MRFRPALTSDAPAVAALHADSWRRYYRGAYADAYLDGDIDADRVAVWSARLAVADLHRVTLVAEPEPAEQAGAADESDTRHMAVAASALVGFVHLVVDDDPRWGSLIDNLHVATGRHRGGVGSGLIMRAAEVAAERGATPALYLWVQEQNAAAQAFYAAHGGQVVEHASIAAPGGVPGRLNGNPRKLRIAWPDARAVVRQR